MRLRHFPTGVVCHVTRITVFPRISAIGSYYFLSLVPLMKTAVKFQFPILQKIGIHSYLLGELVKGKKFQNPMPNFRMCYVLGYQNFRTGTT